MIAGILLLYAVYSIRRYLKSGLSSSQINECNLAMHAVCFFCFSLNLIVEQVFYIVNSMGKSGGNGWEKYLIAVSVSVSLSFVSQLLFIGIFYKLGKIPPKSRSQSTASS